MMYGIEAAVAVLMVMLACNATHAQVVGWRGDNTGVFPADCKPVTEWDGKSGKNIVWKTPLPNHGNSSPIVVGKKVIVTCEPGYPAGVDAPLLMCFDADAGKELWRQQMDPFAKLPDGQRESLVKLRAEYWDLLRKVHTMYVEWEDSTDEARKAALQTEAQKLCGQQFDKRTDSWRPNRLLSTKMTPELKKRFEPLMRGEIEFNEPDWHWTGIGVSMPTPVSDGKYIYVNNGFKFTACYDLAGNQKWLVYHKDIPYRHHWVELFGESPMLVDGRLVVHMLDHLICYERETGKVLWMVKTRAMVKGHGMGQATVLRLTGPTVTEPVTAIFSQFGELVRLEDGHVYADDIGFFDNAACLCSNGRDTIYANNGATGGGWDGTKYGQGRRFMEPGGMAIRFTLEDRNTAKAEQLWSKGPKLSGVPFYHEGRIYANVGVYDAATGKEIGNRARTKWYNGSILANNHFYGNLKDGGDNDRGAPCPFATEVLQVTGDTVKQVAVNTLETVPDPEGGPEHRAKVIAVTGQFAYGGFYGWHTAWSTPFASGNRLFIRTYDHLWCIGDKGQAFVPSTEFGDKQ